MFDFLRYKKIYFFISALVIVPGLISLALFGLRPSIDFTGGTLYEFKLKSSVEVDDLEGSLEEGLRNSDTEASPSSSEERLENQVWLYSIQRSGDSSFLIKLSPMSEAQRKKLNTALSGKYGGVEEIRFETIGPTLGRELLVKTLIAVLIAAASIVTYIAWTFKSLQYGISAVLAMFHDTFILLGSFSLLGHFYGVEVDTLFVTAVLTTLSFSVHDTIVVFDRIRESVKDQPAAEFTMLVNKAVSETLVRSLNNSLTIVFMLLALILLGGVTIRWFVVALLIGTISGTYSSTFTAAPILVTLRIWKVKRNK